jgi:hypothetical protein
MWRSPASIWLLYFRQLPLHCCCYTVRSSLKLQGFFVAMQVVTTDPDEITPAQRMTAGALAGATAQATIYPFELVGG